jgi:DNA-3-methyladenine glycosylase
MILKKFFFARDPQVVARDLLGKVLCHCYKGIWLSAQIIETEAYYIHEKGSHSSLGYTEKRKALFMPAGTIYMYYARGGDSLNVSCKGKGNAVLIKSGYPYGDDKKMLQQMQRLNPQKNGQPRPIEKLCSGQTLLCKSLGLKVPEWNQQQFDRQKFYIEDVGCKTNKIIQTARLGIPKGRDEHLLYRFVSHEHALYCTKNPLRKNRLVKATLE